MPLAPTIGERGGQEYDVARAIRTFLEQMAGGAGFSFGGAVIKELIQNADDAGASELLVALDERMMPDLPAECVPYSPLWAPALLVRNDAPFRVAGEVAVEDKDDFAAICDVAGGHKRFTPTAAGRFGIGFNSVYFLTDTPLLFSRREVHLFDLRHLMFNANGWKFLLDQFPAAASSAGPIKCVLDWVLPKAIVGHAAFQEVANDGTDYRSTVFRLPLRQTVEPGSKNTRGSVFQGASFPQVADREKLVRDMCEQAKRSLLFLKSLRRIVFGRISEKLFEEDARVEVTRIGTDLEPFLRRIREIETNPVQAQASTCSHRCDVAVLTNGDRLRVAPGNARFLIVHSAGFCHTELLSLAERLRKNEERAVPWVGVAVPLDAPSFDWESGANASWRVFLPLLEEGPCAAVLNAALFVDPSRRAVEFRTDGSDETRRKSMWNRALVEHLLVPLLREATTRVIDEAPQLVADEPKKYLSLFPSARLPHGAVGSLADVVRAAFGGDLWLLKLYDIWREPFDVWIAPDSPELELEKVPEWLGPYKTAFRELTTEGRRFVTWNVGDAVGERLGDGVNVRVTRVGSDVGDCILQSEQPPQPTDLERLLKLLDHESLTSSDLVGRWAFQRAGTDQSLLRFDQDTVYIIRKDESAPIHDTLREVGISFERTEWVVPRVGICSLRSDRINPLANVLEASDAAALELLRRVGNANRHDLLPDHHKVERVVDFLCSQNPYHLPQDLRLAFLVKTAAGKLDRRSFGVVFLRVDKSTRDDDDLWQGLLREAFAEVDPQFAPHLRRALDHAPQLLACFGDDTCDVILTGGDMLDVLGGVRARDAAVVGKLREQLNRQADITGQLRPEAYRAAQVLLREAGRRWEQLSSSARTTVLTLPIHRHADGKLISLCSESADVGPDTIRDRYFLQSQDDLSGAPVDLPTGELLHTLDPEVRRFYRRCLEIREQSKVEVLKECLRQIGVDADRNYGILRYLKGHYRETIERLRDRGGDDLQDLQELEGLYSTARGTPCLDGRWRSATECVGAAALCPLLQKQGWTEEQLNALLCRLAYPHPVADGSSHAASLARSLWEIEELDRDSLANLAITSESPDLSFTDRIRVIADNIKLVAEPPPARAAMINSEIVEAIGEPVEFAKLALAPSDDLELGGDALRVIVPEAADLSRLATRFTGGRIRVLATVLTALGVPRMDFKELRSRVVSRFGAIWSELDSKGRLALLTWLGRSNDTLPLDAPNLETVLVGEGDGRWVSPASVIAPCWAVPAPPNLPALAIPRTNGMSPEILRLWDRWCGVRELGTVLKTVVDSTSQLPCDQWAAAAKRLVRWLDDLAAQRGADRLAAALHDLSWVFARRREETAFKRSVDIVDHIGTEILGHEFWVVEEKIPTSLAKSVQTRRVENTRENLEAIARSLAASSAAKPAAAQSVYQFIVELTSDEAVNRIWRAVAHSMPVYRLFRKVPDQMVSGEELFLGDREVTEDFGQILYCLGGADERRRQIYLKLGVEIRPNAKQLVGALSRIPRESRSADVHRALIDVLSERPPEDVRNLRDADLRNVKVLSCAKTYEPLTRCYADFELDRPKRVSESCRDRLLDGRDLSNRKLVAWLDGYFPDVVSRLRSSATAELTREPEETAGVTANVLDAWRDWLAELAMSGSVVRDEAINLGFRVPAEALQIHVVSKISVRFRLPDASEIVPSEEWSGPELFNDSVRRIFVRRDIVDRDFLGHPGDVEMLDGRIADEVEHLLRANGQQNRTHLPPVGALRSLISTTLERPGAVLKRMSEEKQEHFFHQYLDQTADPEFSNLFDAYRRTSPSAKEKRQSMAKQMWQLISLRFVDARRNQIRGYGYDEFAIFAELIQNAEDAYLQRAHLELPDPPHRGVKFTYATHGGDRTLSVSHYGRPFNLWRNGPKRVNAFRYDVEGVLKSAGSFKPHSRVDGARAIGRFGLGFKSVYLVTNAPRIHSGDWHFEITAGCIPSEIAVPAEHTDKALTRIVLPLIEAACEERDGMRDRYLNLIPFLRQIDLVGVEHSDGESLTLKTSSRTVLRTGEQYQVEGVEIRGATQVTGEVVRLLRVRHEEHEGQFGLLLGDDGLPVAWSDAFESDVFAVLPLRVRLGCGVGVSNLFEVQSGRTHLIDPAANERRIAEVSACLRPLVKAVIVDENNPTGEAMSRFWSLWRWDRSDKEADALRRALARELVQLTRSMPVVPTLDRDKCTQLGKEVLFAFDNLPEELTSKLMEKMIELAVGGRRVPVQPMNVVPAPIRSAIERAYTAAGEKGGIVINRVGWPELGEEFQARPWLAEHPDLVSAMARSLPAEGLEQLRSWLGKCLFRSASGKQEHLADLLPSRFPGKNHLPERFLNLLDVAYDEAAVGLLKQVGLPSRPPLETVRRWLRSGFIANECNELLQFLSEAGRWRREYYDLRSSLTSPWFDATNGRVTTTEAIARGLVSLQNLDPDPAFRAWLGIDTGPIQINLDGSRWDRPVRDPQKALNAIWEWWVEHSAESVKRYEQRTYPTGTPPPLEGDFSDRDTLQRQSWLSLMMLASLQTIGRANPQQHRNFLRQCAQRGWLDVFADPLMPADDWIRVLEDFLGAQAYDIPFYHWVRQFVSVYQIARWLPEYVWTFLSIDKMKQRFDLDQVIRPATNPDFSGGGPSAPPLTRALGIGSCFVVRELVRTGVLTSSLAHDHAYVPIGRVRHVLARLGMTGLDGELANHRHSRRIHDFLIDHLGSERADFNRGFDLPFLAIADDPALQTRFLDCHLPPSYEEGA